jgi:hypothetical protein
MPFFEDLVKGCFVRVGIGQNEGRSIYRVGLYILHVPYFILHLIYILCYSIFFKHLSYFI